MALTLTLSDKDQTLAIQTHLTGFSPQANTFRNVRPSYNASKMGKKSSN